jgi:hypothetical protein
MIVELFLLRIHVFIGIEIQLNHHILVFEEILYHFIVRM